MYKNILYFAIAIFVSLNIQAQNQLVSGSITSQDLKLLWGEQNSVNHIPIYYSKVFDSNSVTKSNPLSNSLTVSSKSSST